MNDQALTEGSQGSTGLSGFLKACLSELRCNIKRSGRNIVFDAIVLFACFVLFESNNLFLKPWISTFDLGTIDYLMQCHANDFLGGLAFLAYTNLLIDIVKPEVRFKSFKTILVYIFLCGTFWEYIAPVFIANSVGDPYDLLAYAIGGTLYFVLNALFCRSGRSTEISRLSH